MKGNGIKDEGLEFIAKILDVNDKLEELDVSLNEITSNGVEILSTTLPESGIKVLNLSKNQLGDEGIIAIVNCTEGQDGFPL